MLRSFDELNYRQEPRFHLELGLLKLVHTQRLIPLEQILSQLPGGQLAAAGGNVSRAAASLPGNSTARAASAPSPASSPAPIRNAAPQAAPPRSVASTEAARGGSVASSTPSTQPSFSPFESDTRRKSGPSGSAAVSSEPASVAPLEVGTLVVETAVALDEPPTSPAIDAEPETLQHEPPDPQIRGHVSPEAERIAADLEEEIASDGEPEPPASGEFISLIDKLRDAVAQALHDKGHETASALLRAGEWSVSEGSNTITVLVAVKKTMLSLTMNPEAERIARTALQQSGSSAKLIVLPGDGSASPAPPRRTRRQGHHPVARARQSPGEAGAGALPRRSTQHP